jgi:hypothetical protein
MQSKTNMKARFRWRYTSIVCVATLAVASLAGCKGASADAAAVKEEPPVSVQTEAVQVIEVPRTLRLTGTLRGDRGRARRADQARAGVGQARYARGRAVGR